MTLILDLPAELQARLEREAAREGVAPQDYALKALDAALPPQTPETEPTWGQKRVETLRAIGAIWQDRTESSAELAQQFRAAAERRGTSE